MPAIASIAAPMRSVDREASPPPGPLPVSGPTITPARSPVGLVCTAVALAGEVFVGAAGVDVDVTVGVAVLIRVVAVWVVVADPCGVEVCVAVGVAVGVAVELPPEG